MKSLDVNDLKQLFSKAPPGQIRSPAFLHTAAFKSYMADPVAAEKKLLTQSGIDWLNVHGWFETRAAEIHRFVADELRDADRQHGEHLSDLESQYRQQVERQAEKQAESARLQSDLDLLRNQIDNLEAFLDQKNTKKGRRRSEERKHA